VRAQSIAQQVGSENLQAVRRSVLGTIVAQAEAQVGGRVIVVDASGRLLADSQGPATDQPYASTGRPEIIAALAGRPTSEIRYSSDLRQSIMVTAVPIVDEGSSSSSVVGVVRISQSMAEVNGNVRHTLLGLMTIGGAVLVVGLVLAFVLANSISRPLAKLTGAASRLGGGDMSARVGRASGAREVEELAVSFDEMAEQVEDTMRMQRQFVANASHQLRTPLTGMKLRLESALGMARDDDLRSQLTGANLEVDRLAATVDRLLQFGKRVESEGGSAVEIGEAAGRAVERWDVRGRSMGSTLHLEGDGGWVRIDPTDLDQILDNLLDNAIIYAPGRIEVSVGNGDGTTRLSVVDHGAGIGPDDLPFVTERFFRGRGTGPGGSGLGLAVVRELAERWGGTVTISSPADTGTTVEVTFPASPLTFP
jgi:signal transduction histidine kinase